MKNVTNKKFLKIIILTLVFASQISLTSYAQEGLRLCPGGMMLPIEVACPTPAPTQSPSTGKTGATTIVPAPTQSPSTGNTSALQIISLPNPLGSVKTIPQLIGRIVDWLILIASIAVLPLMIVWGAYQLLMAGADPKKVTDGRHTITWAIAGYALLLISKGIEFIIRDVLK